MFYRSPSTLAMIKVAKKSGPKYDPDIIAHELGHARLHGKSRLLMPARAAAPLVGQAAGLATNSPAGLAGHLIPLADEGYASVRGMKTLKDWGLSKEDRRAARKRLGIAYASYAAGPALDAGLTIGGLASGNDYMRFSAPIVGKLTSPAVAPLAAKAMTKIPIRKMTKREAQDLAKKTDPNTDLYLSGKKLRRGGAYISPPLSPSLADMGLRKKLDNFVSRRDSDRLMRRGGVLVGPAE